VLDTAQTSECFYLLMLTL